MSRRPTGKGVVVVAIGALVMLVGAAGHVGWLFVIAAGVEGLVFGSLFVPHRLSSAVVRRAAPSYAVAGDTVEVKLSIGNPTQKSLPLMRVEDQYGAFPTAAGVLPGLPPGQTHVAATRRTARRGVYGEGTILLASGAPFGFLVTRQTFISRTPLVVVPRSVELPALSLIDGGPAVDNASRHRVRAGAGDEYVGVRPYRPGDSRRAVHWRSSARARILVVREFEERSGGDVALVIHGDEAGDPPDSAFEMLVSAAASIARHTIEAGHRVHMTRPDPDGILHVAEPSITAALDWLAAANPTDSKLLPTVTAALARCGRRGAVVVLTTTAGRSLQDLEAALGAISAAGGRASVVIARCATWSKDRANDADLVQAVRATGYPVRVLARSEDLKSCLMA